MALRKCPLCLTPVREATLGLRDYRWLGDALPGKVAPMDLDFFLERKGQFLIIEMKPKHGVVSRGQMYSFAALEKAGATVWLVRGDINGEGGDLTVQSMSDGSWTAAGPISIAGLKQAVADWWEAADA